MSPAHRHVEAGGDPAQGPADDLANEPRSPRDGNDFPDIPDANAPGRGTAGGSTRPPDQPDLDRFAERLGIADDTSRSDTGDRNTEDLGPPTDLRGRVGRVLAAGAGTSAEALRSAARWLDRLSSRVRG